MPRSPNFAAMQSSRASVRQIGGPHPTARPPFVGNSESSPRVILRRRGSRLGAGPGTLTLLRPFTFLNQQRNGVEQYFCLGPSASLLG